MAHDIPMAEALARHARSDPHREALICGDQRWTFAELDEASWLAAHVLRARGVRPGDTVAIALPNGPEHIITTFAAWKVGASPLPLSVQAPQVEREAMLKLAQPRVLVGAVSTDVCPVLRVDALTSAAADGLREVPGDSQPWKVIGSGGSTGRPKLIVAGHPARLDPQQPRYTIEPGDRVFVPGPLYHQGPFIFVTAGLLLGNTVVMMTRFDAAEALQLMATEQVTWAFLVPTMTHRIWRLPEQQRAAADLGAMRLVLSTGAPWAPWLKAEWINWLGPERILEFYGGTEEQGGLSITGTESLQHPGAIGRRTDSVRVVDREGKPVPTGEVGELEFRARATGSHQYLGADNNSRGGWRSYGDLAFIDEHDYVHIADRRTDLIVTGGVNVYPAEVEAALEAHPQVRSAVVIGLPDEEWGQSVHAVVEVAESCGVGSNELTTYLRDVVAGPKVPRTFEFVHTPLRDDAGKVRRGRLRDERMLGKVFD